MSWTSRSTSIPRSATRWLGRVSLEDGAVLTMLKFPDEEVVTLELVHRPSEGRFRSAPDSVISSFKLMS